jgi:flagellar basal body-associated protein FliL
LAGGIFTRIEKWAAESGDRTNLLTILICVAFVVLVLAIVGGIALFSLMSGSGPPGPSPS